MAKSRKLFLSDYCLTPFENIPSSGILCDGEKIIATGGATAFSLSEPGLEVIKLENTYALPGFIDSHIHGAGGFDSLDACKENYSINGMCSFLAKHGVTTFFPTLVSAPRELMLKSIDALAKIVENTYDGADPAGMHLEGPFINPEKHGSQEEQHISKIDLGYARELIEAGQGRIKLITFAPELDKADELITLMLEHGVIPSMGHSMADEKSVLRAIDAGARRCTHLYNGMPQLHHRRSSLTDVALTDNRVSIELIVDGAHIHPRMVDLASRAKPIGKLIGVSNSIEPTGSTLPNMDYLEEGGLVLTGEGIIAGTTQTLETGWHHLVSYARMPRTVAAACFTSNPASDLGLITRGEIKPGKRADITFFDSNTNVVKLTVSKGRIVYTAPETNA